MKAIMKAMMTVTLLGISLLLTTAAIGKDGKDECATRDLAGRWIFGTDVGQQLLFLPTSDGNITALGTMNIDKQGNLSGEFDATVAGFIFLSASTYSGSAVLHDDCTGTLSFETSDGTVRADSIALVGRDEVWGMSQDPSNLWTYEMRRLSGKSVKSKKDH
jgi:hypothetical protein